MDISVVSARVSAKYPDYKLTKIKTQNGLLVWFLLFKDTKEHEPLVIVYSIADEEYLTFTPGKPWKT